MKQRTSPAYSAIITLARMRFSLTNEYYLLGSKLIQLCTVSELNELSQIKIIAPIFFPLFGSLKSKFIFHDNKYHTKHKRSR